MATKEATTEKVWQFLKDEFGDVRTTAAGFAIEYGSTVVLIEAREWVADEQGNPRSVVYIWAPICREVPATPEMFHWAATEGRQQLFGGVAVLEPEGDEGCFLVFDHTLLGDYLESPELITALAAVVVNADALDDLVIGRFGGKRYIDPG